MTDLLTPALDKVPRYHFKGLTAPANKPPNLQIFAHSTFCVNRSTGLKFLAKKFICGQSNFLAITLKPMDQLIPNFEGANICMFGSLFAKALALEIIARAFI